MTITNADLLKKHPIYGACIETMQAYEQAYLGGTPFKKSVRKKRPSEDSSLYTDLIANTTAQPICRYVVDTINDVLFEPGVQRDIKFCTSTGSYINPDNTEWAELMLLDADLQNRSLNSFQEGVGDLCSIFGHCWVFVDMPKATEGNLGRPYVCAISPLNVWNWEWDFYGGKPMLTSITVLEMEEEDCYYIKRYTLGDATTPSYWMSFEVPKNAQDEVAKQAASITDTGQFPAGMALPGFIAYGRRDPRCMDIGVSDIDSASDAMREIYKLEAEAYTSIQFAKTILRADKGISIPVHAGAIARGGSGSIEAIKVDTNDVNVIIQKQNDILNTIEGLTGLGGLRNTRNQVQSGVSIIEERKTLHRVCKSKARLMEVVEESIWTFAARFMDCRWAGKINYNTDYESYDTNYRLALMAKAKELVPVSPLIDAMIAKEIISMLAPQEEVSTYTGAYIGGIVDPIVKALFIKEDQQPKSTDIGSMLPAAIESTEPSDTGDNPVMAGEQSMTATQAIANYVAG